MKQSDSTKQIKTRLISARTPYKNPFIIESAITGKKGVNINTEEHDEAREEAFKRQNNIGARSY